MALLNHILLCFLALLFSFHIVAQNPSGKYSIYVNNYQDSSVVSSANYLIEVAEDYRLSGDYNTYIFLIREASYLWMDEHKYTISDSVLQSALVKIYHLRDKFPYPFYMINYTKAYNFSNWLVPDSSEKYWQITSELVNQEDVREKAKIISARAYLLRLARKNEAARKMYLEAEKLYTSLNSHSLEELVSINNNIAITYTSDGDFDSAVIFYQKALDFIQKDCQEPSGLSTQIKHNLGINYYNIGRFDKAEQLFREVVKECQQMESLPQSYFLSKDQLASLYKLKGHYRKALKIYLEIIADMKADQSQSKPNFANAHMKVGLLYQKEGDHDRALQYFQVADEILSEFKDGSAMAVGFLYSYIATSYLAKGENQKALNYYSQEFDVFVDMFGKEHPSMSFRYINLARSYEALGDMDSAAALYEKALALQRQKVNRIPYLNMIITKVASFYIRQQEWKRAIVLLEEGYNIYQKNATKGKIEANLLYLMALAQAHINKDAAIRYSDELTSWLDEQNHQDRSSTFAFIDLEQRNYALRGDIYFEKYKETYHKSYLLDAFTAYNRAITILSEYKMQFNSSNNEEIIARKSAELFDNALAINHLLFQKTSDLKYIEAAFQISEFTKSSALMEAVNASATQVKLGVPPKILTVAKMIKSEISFYEEKLNEAAEDKNTAKISEYRKKLFNLNTYNDRLKNYFAEKYPRYSQLIYKKTAPSLDAVRESLKDDQIFIEYFNASHHIYAIAVSKDNITLEAIPFLSDNNYINKYIELLQHSPALISATEGLDARAMAHELYDKLLAPFLKGGKYNNITIVPDRALSLLPFDALIDGEGNYLLENYSLAYAYSAAHKLQENQNKKLNKNYAFAGFGYNRSNLTAALDNSDISNYSSLPYAETEVKNIAAVMNGKAFVNDDATKSNFYKIHDSYDILHFSLHGLVDHQYPLASRLIFNENVHDYELKAGEILNMTLKKELVVLSACNSGSGAYQEGEGVMHLARSFAYAGSKSMVMSLWQVSDHSSSQILTQFYKNIKKGMSKDDALQKAKQHYLNATSDPLLKHPYYWASLVPIGDMQPLQFKNVVEKENHYDISRFAILVFIFFIGAAFLHLYLWKNAN